MSRTRSLRRGTVALAVTSLACAVGSGYAGDTIRTASSPYEQLAIQETNTLAQGQPQRIPGRPPDMPQPSPIPPAADPMPPPGTIGHTYQRRSWLIPVEKHPRVAMLDVTVSGASEVHVYTTNQYRLADELDGFQDPENPDVWHFETDPLIPGLPHVYRVEAARPEIDPSLADVRYVRLIRGRRVMLEYEPLGVME